ncbi:MAG: LPS assembly lipoprotein LptE [Legionellaceae bacterium]|nr:LPS assembly lipoprotein LptE [Legionellaceae bacterium]
MRRAFLVFVIFFLSSCGFHLRGMIDMPTWLNNVAIIIEKGHRDLKPLLQEQLEAYHIRVTSDITHARYWLIIEQDSEQQHITSVSSSTTPRQYQMTYTVRYKLQEANGKTIIPPCNVVTTRQLTVNSNRILGSNDEEEILKKEMRQDAVIQILDRIGKHGQ